MSHHMRPLRAVLATLSGGAAGAVVLGAGLGYGVSATGQFESLAATAAAVVGAGVGSLVGAAVALGWAFRRAPPSERRTTIVTMLLVGPLLFAALSIALAGIDPALSLPPLWLAIALPASALLGRRLATRGRAR